MLVNRKNIIFPIQLLVTSPVLVYIALYGIKNPDLEPYIELLNSLKSFGLGIEPTLYIFAATSRTLASLLGGDSVFIFYFLYIFSLQFFLLNGFYNIANRSILNSNILLFFWLLIYGTVHCLIQIRFGLANAIFIYIFSLLFVKSSTLKTFIFGFFGFLTHYSSIFAVFSLFFIKLRKVFYNIDSYKIIHLGFIIILCLFKFGSIFSLLPDFLSGRISGYVDNENVDQISNFSIYISIICYLTLVLTPRVDNEKINMLRIYGALGFLPYFIVPDLEIIVRLGIPFQYLLLPYLLLSFRYKQLALFTTLPLLGFFLYKIFSSINAFLGYL